MSDYKRIVSYMYDYEDSIKKNNVGFARVESRNGQCKIVINIKALSLNSSSLKGYIFKRVDGKIVPVLMGNIPVRNGVADFRITTNPSRMMNTDSSLEQMCGIIVYHSKDKFFATEWDDNPIKIDSVNEFEGINIKSEEKKEEQIPIIIEDETIVSMEELPESQQEQKQEIPIMKYRKIFNALPVQEGKEVEEPIQQEMPKEAISSQNEPCIDGGETDSQTEIPIDPSAARIFSRFMEIHPFETKDIIECVRIEPQDIGVFPMENWILGNNSFLLHGYYNYRHLIFARKRTELGCQYIIGVPGVYQNRDKFVARMFGFEHFQPTEIKERKTGEFGYWYIPVVL